VFEEEAGLARHVSTITGAVRRMSRIYVGAEAVTRR